MEKRNGGKNRGKRHELSDRQKSTTDSTSVTRSRGKLAFLLVSNVPRDVLPRANFSSFRFNKLTAGYLINCIILRCVVRTPYRIMSYGKHRGNKFAVAVMSVTCDPACLSLHSASPRHHATENCNIFTVVFSYHKTAIIRYYNLLPSLREQAQQLRNNWNAQILSHRLVNIHFTLI